MDLIGKKWWFLLISGIIIIPGIISLILWGIVPSIDFTGGTLLEVRITESKKNINNEAIRNVAKAQKIELISVAQSDDDAYLLRSKLITKEQNTALQDSLNKSLGKTEELRFETVGPTIGEETTRNAFIAVVVASLAIIAYIALSFRHIPAPHSSWKFGFAAVLALIHDVLVVVGIFSLLGHFYKVEVDSLFITALLTVMGFSVHDSIVVFDRIRENLRVLSGRNFSDIVNESLVQTLGRSLSTSLTVILTLFALLLFSGESIRWFVFALLIGIISGSYSSIFNAAPILVIWEDWSRKSQNK